MQDCPEDGRPIDAAEAWACAAMALYWLGFLFGAASVRAPELALTSLCMLLAGGVAHLRSRA